jgi:hypothetical protein
MACNCMTNEQLKNLYDRFAYDKKNVKVNGFWSNVKFYAEKFVLQLILLLIVPLIFVYVAYLIIFKDGKLSLKNFFNLKGEKIDDYYARQQQKYTNKDKG